MRKAREEQGLEEPTEKGKPRDPELSDTHGQIIGGYYGDSEPLAKEASGDNESHHLNEFVGMFQKLIREEGKEDSTAKEPNSEAYMPHDYRITYHGGVYLRSHPSLKYHGHSTRVRAMKPLHKHQVVTTIAQQDAFAQIKHKGNKYWVSMFTTLKDRHARGGYKVVPTMKPE